MTLRKWLNKNRKIAMVDYVCYDKDGNEVENGLEYTESLNKGPWYILTPRDILNYKVLKARTRRVFGRRIAFVNIISK